MISPSRLAVAAVAVALALIVAPVTSASAAKFPYTDYHSPTQSESVGYFAGLNGTKGVELYKTDGTDEGTTFLKDVYAGTGSAFRAFGEDLDPQFTDLGSTTIFVANSAKGVQLWATKGTSTSTIQLTTNTNGTIGANPTGLTAYNGLVYFAATSKKYGRELWRTDGTVKGTKLALDIVPPASEPVETKTSGPVLPGSFPHGFEVLGDKLFFIATNSSGVDAIWSVSGTTISLGVTISESSGELGEGGLSALSAKLAYVLDDPAGTRSLWTSDGTSGGTVKLTPPVSISYESVPQAFGGQVFFEGNGSATTGASNNALWRKSTAQGSAPVQVSQGSVIGYSLANGALWYISDDGSSKPYSLWTLASGTGTPTLVKNLGTTSQELLDFDSVTVGGKLYFWAYGSLWTSDGTSGGTTVVKDFGLSSNMALDAQLGVSGSSVTVTILDIDRAGSMWVSDGTTAGTVKLLPRLPFTTSPTPTIKGAATIGTTLKAGVGTWKPTADTRTYQWKANGTSISGATGSTFVVTSAVAGKVITFSVTGRKLGYTTTIKTSAATATVKSAFTTMPTPVITGDVAIRSKLKVVAGTWAPTATLTYQWYADGKAISKATKTSYTIPKARLGEKFSVKVTGKKTGYVTGTKMTARTTSAMRLFTKTPVPTVAGSTVVGSTLTATAGKWSPTATTLKYQWRNDGVAISGATKTTYVVTSADAGHKITVTVRAGRSGYSTLTRDSVALSASAK